MIEYLFVLFVLIVVNLVLLLKSIKIIRTGEKAIIERMGKYMRTIDSGVIFVIPLVDKVIKVNMREQLADIPPQEVTTKDNVMVKVRPVIHYQVLNPVKVIYNVTDFEKSFVSLVQTTVKDLVSGKRSRSLDSAEFADELQEMLNEATEPWGVIVTRGGFQEVESVNDF